MATKKLNATAPLIMRPYQETDVANIEQAWLEHLGVLYQLPTGGGKSVVFSKIISDYYKNEQIIVFAHKRKLLFQLRERLTKMGIKSGILIGQTSEDLDSNVVLVSIRTAVKAKRLEELVKRPWSRCIIDEARHSRTGSYDTVLDRLREVHPMHKLLGVDATPYRKDKKRLDKHFSVMVTSCEDVKSLQEKGYLAKEKIFATPIGEIEEQVKEVANDYQQTQLSNYMRQPKYLNYVVDAYIKYGESRQAIVFAVDKAHSKDLFEMFKTKGITSIARIDSDSTDDEIDAVYKAYEVKKLQIIVNVEMVTEGVDLPETGCIVGARPTKSLTLYMQMVGRGTRVKEDGSELYIIDCAGWTEAFGSVSSKREWSLDPEKDPNDPRKKNRIVGRDKDGNLTADLSQIAEFSELTELTPEEYIGQVKGGLEAAQKQNQTIDEKIIAAKKDLEELLHKAALDALKQAKQTVSPFSCVLSEEGAKRSRGPRTLICYVVHSRHLKAVEVDENEEVNHERIADTFTWDKDKVSSGKMYLDVTEKDFLHMRVQHQGIEDYWGEVTKDKQKILEYKELTCTVGLFNQSIVDNKNLLMQIIEKKKVIYDLAQTKINLKEYKDLAKKFEQDNWKKAVEETIAKGDQVKFTKDLDKDNYFKGYNSNYSDRMVGITVKGTGINVHHNTIDIHMSNSRTGQDWVETKKYISGERVWNMIEDGKPSF